MKKLIFTMTLAIVALILDATTYRVAPSGGDATSFSGISYVAGDTIAYEKGHTYNDYLSITTTGTEANPIVITSYGIGSNPIISGFTTVSSFTNLGGNIWESTDAVSSLSNCSIVLINGTKATEGRYPNSGWLTYQTCVAETSITSSDVNSSIVDWTGADIVIREAHWLIGNYPIANHSGGTITYSGSAFSTCFSGYGFFITNDERTLDSQNEWYYNPITKKLRIYSTSEPTDVKVSSADNLVSILNTISYITISGIDFSGANSDAIHLETTTGISTGEQHITISNCSISYSGRNAVTAIRSKYLTVQNCTITNTNNNAIDLDVNSSYATVSYNAITNTALIAGESQSGEQTGMAIDSNGRYANIEYNTIDSTGYNGMFLYNSDYLVKNNFVNHSCLLKDDGAGIYTYIGSSGTIFTNRKIIDNIVINSIGNGNGTADNEYSARGIYLDGYTVNVDVIGNTVANCSNYGIYINGSKNLRISNNTSFNNLYQIYLHNWGGYTMSGLDVKSNILVAKSTNQYAMGIWSVIDSIAVMGSLDSNYYARPIDNYLIMRYGVPGSTMADHTLSEWKASFASFDLHSTILNFTIASSDSISLIYNASSTAQFASTPWPATLIDGRSIGTSVYLQPFTSAIVVRSPFLDRQKVAGNNGKVLFNKNTNMIMPGQN